MAKDNKQNKKNKISNEFFKGKYNFYFDFDVNDKKNKVIINETLDDLPVYSKIEPEIFKKKLNAKNEKKIETNNKSNFLDDELLLDISLNADDLDLSDLDPDNFDSDLVENTVFVDKNPSFQNFLLDLHKILKNPLAEDLEKTETIELEKSAEEMDLNKFFHALDGLLKNNLPEEILPKNIALETKKNNFPVAFPEILDEVVDIKELPDESKIIFTNAELDTEIVIAPDDISKDFNNNEKININGEHYTILYVFLILFIILLSVLNIYKAHLFFTDRNFFPVLLKNEVSEEFDVFDIKHENILHIKNLYIKLAEDLVPQKEAVYKVQIAFEYSNKEDEVFLLENKNILSVNLYKHLIDYTENEITNNKFDKEEFLIFINKKFAKEMIRDFEIVSLEKI